ncbi:MAG: chromate transporter [Fibrella sp.]|nr:chromate transporter [Armatimonadota bacterium]
MQREPPMMVSPPSLLEIARVFLLLGVTAFGGQPALLALLNRDLAERRGWVTSEQITEAFTYTKLLPGPVVVQVVAYLGYRLNGVRGVFTATIFFLLPSVATMLALGATYQRIATNHGVIAALGGLTAAVVGVILVATVGQAKKAIQDAVSAVVAVAVCIAAVVWNVNPALLVLAAGALGILREARRPPTTTEDATR